MRVRVLQRCAAKFLDDFHHDSSIPILTMTNKTSHPIDEWHMLREMNETRLTFIKEQLQDTRE